MEKGVNEITVEEAANYFSRSQKQIRRIVDESVHGKRDLGGNYLVFPDPLFARRVPQAKGHGFFWLIDKERMQKHFNDKVDRQLQRIEDARRAAAGSDSPQLDKAPVNSFSGTKIESPVVEPFSSTQDTRDIVTVYEGLVETYKRQLEVKDTQLASRDSQINSLIEEVAASKKRSDTLQGALIAIAQGKQLDVQRIQEGEVAIVDEEVGQQDNHKPNKGEQAKKPGLFSRVFGRRN